MVRLCSSFSSSSYVLLFGEFFNWKFVGMKEDFMISIAHFFAFLCAFILFVSLYTSSGCVCVLKIFLIHFKYFGLMT